MLIPMPKANPKSIAELEAQKKAIKEAANAEVAAIRKAAADRVNALKSSERRLRALDIREQKRRDNHAKILVGVAMIHQCQTSEVRLRSSKGCSKSSIPIHPNGSKLRCMGSGWRSRNRAATRNRTEQIPVRCAHLLPVICFCWERSAATADSSGSTCTCCH